jgi:DNA-binding GntR family transcriptional regulator
MQPIWPLRRPKTLTEQAADAIRARIVGGEFALGEALSEITLAAELGVTKTVIREAFLQLKNEDLVEIKPQYGTFVFRITPVELKHLIEMWEIIEVNSLQFGMKDDNENLNRSLILVLDGMKEAIKIGDLNNYIHSVAEFHYVIVRASGNPFIESAYKLIAFRIQAVFSRIRADGHCWRVLDEYVFIVDLVRKNDFEEASEALIRCLRKTFSDFVATQPGTAIATGS